MKKEWNARFKANQMLQNALYHLRLFSAAFIKCWTIAGLNDGQHVGRSQRTAPVCTKFHFAYFFSGPYYEKQPRRRRKSEAKNELCLVSVAQFQTTVWCGLVVSFSGRENHDLLRQENGDRGERGGVAGEQRSPSKLCDRSLWVGLRPSLYDPSRRHLEEKAQRNYLKKFGGYKMLTLVSAALLWLVRRRKWIKTHMLTNILTIF